MVGREGERERERQRERQTERERKESCSVKIILKEKKIWGTNGGGGGRD